MSRILFVVSSEKGRLNACIGPAARLQQLGHNVAFYSYYNISDQVRRAGFDNFYSAKSETTPPITSNRAKYFAENIKNPEWARFSLKTIYVDRVPAQVEPLRKVAGDFKPDIFVVDPKVYEGPIVAEMEKLPWAAMTPSLTMVSPDRIDSELCETVKWFSKDRDAVFSSFGVIANFRHTDCISPYLNLCFTTDALIGTKGKVDDVKRVGPSLPIGERGDECDFPWKNIYDKVPLIYVWLGTQTFYQPGIMRALLSAVKDREVQLVCASSELTSSLRLEYIPQNVILVEEAPQLALMPAVRAFITHGGATSVMEALSMGVPMLVTPFYDDQDYQAHFIERCGVGQCKNLSKLDPDLYWQTIQTILESPRIKETTEKVQRSYKKNDGASEAARLIDQLLSQS